MACWREEVNACERCYLQKHPEERHKPTTEPFLSEWLALHKQHLKALRDGKKDPLRLCDAAKLADAKYAVYRRSADWNPQPEGPAQSRRQGERAQGRCAGDRGGKGK
jgi:hypothetical protein